jgi:hypothetical protein
VGRNVWESGPSPDTLLSLVESYLKAMSMALQPALRSLSGQQLTNVLWSMARMGKPPEDPKWLIEASSAALDLMCVGSMRPHQIAFTFAALQNLGAPLEKVWVDEVRRLRESR